jgi:hypothetical protein
MRKVIQTKKVGNVELAIFDCGENNREYFACGKRFFISRLDNPSGRTCTIRSNNRKYIEKKFAELS